MISGACDEGDEKADGVSSFPRWAEMFSNKRENLLFQGGKGSSSGVSSEYLGRTSPSLSGTSLKEALRG